MKKIFGFLLLILCSTSYAQTPLDTLTYLKKNPNIYAILLSKNNKIIFKKYYNQHTQKDFFNDQSLTKCVVSLLMGIAIDKGYIKNVNEKIADFFPEIKNDTDARKQTVTIKDVMNQASGFYHEESIFAFLQLPDPSGYVIKAPMSADPGKVFLYSNAATHLLSVILSKSTGMNTRAFAKKFLFAPMGIANFTWQKMNDGYYDGSGLLSIYMRAPDMLKIGLLVLNKGKYANKQIVADKWISQIIQPETVYRTEWGLRNSLYGLCWYHADYHGTNIVYGLGWGGQYLFVIPSFNSVVVINENTADATAVMQAAKFLNQVFPLIINQLK